MKLTQDEKGRWFYEDLGDLNILIPWDCYDEVFDMSLIEKDKKQLEHFFDKLQKAEEILLINEPDEQTYPDCILLKTLTGLFGYDVYGAMSEFIVENFQYVNTKQYSTLFINLADFLQYVQNTCKNKQHTKICTFNGKNRKFFVIHNN
jgi:hypothetical protein